MLPLRKLIKVIKISFSPVLRVANGHCPKKTMHQKYQGLGYVPF